MAETLARTNMLMEAATAAARQLVSVRQRADGAYFDLPLTYPSGASVVVRVDGGPTRFLVTDFGMGHLEADLMGATTPFARQARPIADASGVGFDQRAFFVGEVEREQIAGAIVAVANCSHEAVVLSSHRLSEKVTRDQTTALYERLVRVFPKSIVERDTEIVGSTNTTWHVTTLVRAATQGTIFDLVARHPVSVAFATAKFRDIAMLERPPNKVAVVSKKDELGTYLGVLSMDASVIERNASDEVFIRLAEAA